MNTKAFGSARRLLDVILDGPHELVLSEFLLEETARVLHYPRLQNLYHLTADDIAEHVQLLRATAEIVSPIISAPVVRTDPDDDPVVYTAVAGRADTLCTLDRDFYIAEVISFCRDRGIEVMNDVELLQMLLAKELPKE